MANDEARWRKATGAPLLTGLLLSSSIATKGSAYVEQYAARAARQPQQ
jgi:hypothetical protein